MPKLVDLGGTMNLSAVISSLEPRWGDLIMIDHSPRNPHGEILYELIIADTQLSSSPADLRLLTLPSEDWVSFHLNTIGGRPMSRANMPDAHSAHHIPRDTTGDAGTRIILRPMNETIIQDMFGGKCPCDKCFHGVVRVNRISPDHPGLWGISRATQLTLCPCCMNMELLREHDQLILDVADARRSESAEEKLLRDAEIRDHRNKIDLWRLIAGYAVLPTDPGLYGLGVQPGDSTNEIRATPLDGYLSSMSRNEAANLDRIVNMEADQPTRRREHPVSAPRGRLGRRTRGHVEYRRLDIDRRPGSGPTYEVSLGDETRLAEATLRIQEYHATLMGPPQLSLQPEDEETAARNATNVEDDTHLQQAVTRAFNTTDLSFQHLFLRPAIPFPPSPSEHHPRALYSSAICTEPFRWYALVQQRVINDICGICLETFQSGAYLLITGLPCGHFFHEDCVRERRMGERRVDVGCPYRCVGLVRM